MKYSEAEKKIEDLLKSRHDDHWGDYYEIKDEEFAFVLATRQNPSEPFKGLIMVNKQEEGCFEVRDLAGYEKRLANIFMELALTPLDEREDEKRYVVKIGRMGLSENMVYLGANKGTSKLWMGFGGPNGIDNSMVKTIFTQAEIDQLKSKSTLNIDWDKAVKEFKAHTE